MKIAIITDDGKIVSQHFGRAQFYLVATIEDGKVTHREMRPKVGHNQFSPSSQGDHGEHHHEHHGTDGEAHQKHTQMAKDITDCQTVICGGMGRSAYVSMQNLNIRPLVTTLRDVDEVIASFINGSLEDHAELLH
jgi:predicted Fe-Mo cluster-binding NifX family protein